MCACPAHIRALHCTSTTQLFWHGNPSPLPENKNTRHCGCLRRNCVFRCIWCVDKSAQPFAFRQELAAKHQFFATLLTFEVFLIGLPGVKVSSQKRVSRLQSICKFMFESAKKKKFGKENFAKLPQLCQHEAILSQKFQWVRK